MKHTISKSKIKTHKSASNADHVKTKQHNEQSHKKKLKTSSSKVERTPTYNVAAERTTNLTKAKSKHLSPIPSTVSNGLPKNVSNIISTLKNEYDHVENPKKSETSLRTTKSNILKAAQGNTWVERSHNIREKIDEIMKKHTLTLKNLSKLYRGSWGTASSHMPGSNVMDAKWPLIKTASKIRSNVTTASHTRRGSTSSVTSVTSKGKLSRHSSSTSRYNPTAISNITGSMMQIASRNFSSKILQPHVLRDEMKILREKADQAIKFKRTFTICGNYYSVRNALVARGWIEKVHPTYLPPNIDAHLFRRLQMLTIPELSIGLRDKDFSQIYRTVILSKMIGSMPVALYWDLNRDTYRNNVETLKDSLINFINKNRFNFANKQGLCESAKTAYWYNNPGESYLRTPRAYILMNTGDPDEFIKDFKITAAVSLLKWIVHTAENKTSKLISESGKVPLQYFHFALRQCANHARRLRHEDIDKDIPQPSDKEWQTFLDYFYRAIHVGNHFKQSGLESELSLVHKSKTMLKKLQEFDPYLDMDGFMNLWILKPSYGSRGVGIHFCRTLQYILKIIKENRNNSYVIQKYIERPLLIYNTKFDIRQWFLISSTQPITVWIYKECYLRFSSQTYNLRKLHESVHLTNNSVQSKYHNGNRDMCLPSHNMWFLSDFKTYLTNIGYPTAFDNIVFPGMKECIVAAILTNQDQINRRAKSFELHGADFMVTEDFKPWLIEINSKPALNPSTPVTSKLCPMVLEDVIKVVVDNARNPRASTGNFVLIYKEKSTVIPTTEVNLRLEGRAIPKDYFITPEESDAAVSPCSSSDSLSVITTADYIKHVGSEMKKTLKQLLVMIENERTRRANAKTKGNILIEKFNYSEDIQRIQSSMEEMREIFKQDIMAKSDSNMCIHMPMEQLKTYNIRKASILALNKSSRIITNALTSLNKPQNSSTLKDVIGMVSSMHLPVLAKPTNKKSAAPGPKKTSSVDIKKGPKKPTISTKLKTHN